jgi:hypothetical protein
VILAVIPAFGRLRQEDNEFEDSLGCIVNLKTVWETQTHISKN